MSDSLSVSVIVPVFNAQKTIAACLCALKHQTFKGPFEIIVVDDGSSDQTSDIVQSFSDVIYVRQANAGPASARNNGANHSTGEIIFFTDADCVAHDNWIEATLNAFSNPTIAAACGSYDIANPQNLFAQGIYREIIFRHQRLMPDYPRSFGSYNVAIRRSAFKLAGGFDERYRYPSGEDNDLSYKVLQSGKKIYFNRNSFVKHFFPTDLYPYLGQQFRHGFWRVKMYLEHPLMAAGDDYTFWKDIIEPPWVIFIILSLAFSFFAGPSIIFLSICLLALLFLLELIFAGFMIKHFFKAFRFAGVMFLRAFTRTAGFICGVCQFFPAKIFKTK